MKAQSNENRKDVNDSIFIKNHNVKITLRMVKIIIAEIKVRVEVRNNKRITMRLANGVKNRLMLNNEKFFNPRAMESKELSKSVKK
jgi:hypothetical protein